MRNDDGLDCARCANNDEGTRGLKFNGSKVSHVIRSYGKELEGLISTGQSGDGSFVG